MYWIIDLNIENLYDNFYQALFLKTLIFKLRKKMNPIAFNF